MTKKKQIKITRLFGKGGREKYVQPQERQEVPDELQELEQKLKEKQNELFQLQRNSYRHKLSPLKKNPDSFTRPQKIIYSNSVETVKKDIELMSMLSGVEVQSYVADEHCCIVYHMQHESKDEVKHGFKIEMTNGINMITKSSLPLGFNMKAVMEDFQNIMVPECLGSIRKALVAYYDRLEQISLLTKFLGIEAEIFKVLDGSHVEVTFDVKNTVEDDEDPVGVVLMLDYRVYDIRPKNYSFKKLDLPEGAAESLKQQCALLKKKPLRKAFKEAFVTGIGPYKLVPKLGVRASEIIPRKHIKRRPNKPDYRNDDTFRPEECSDYEEEMEE